MKNYFSIVLFFHLFTSADAQSETINSRLFFPIVDSIHSELTQTVRIMDDDTIEVTHRYVFKTIEGINYLNTIAINSDGTTANEITERITKKGLKFENGYKYSYDSTGTVSKYQISGRKKITYPFKPIDQMVNWKVKTVLRYDKRVVVTSKITCLSIDSLETNTGTVTCLKFKRVVDAKWKREFIKDSAHSEYIWSFVERLGVQQYERTGDVNYKGIVIKNELKE